jgi:hypothetical protein
MISGLRTLLRGGRYAEKGDVRHKVDGLEIYLCLSLVYFLCHCVIHYSSFDLFSPSLPTLSYFCLFLVCVGYRRFDVFEDFDRWRF